MQWFEQIAVTRVLTAKQKNMDVPLALKNIGNPIGLRDMEESPQRSVSEQTLWDFLRLSV